MQRLRPLARAVPAAWRRPAVARSLSSEAAQLDDELDRLTRRIIAAVDRDPAIVRELGHRLLDHAKPHETLRRVGPSLAWADLRAGMHVTVGASIAEVKFLCSRAALGGVAAVNWEEAMTARCGQPGVVAELDGDLRAALVRFSDGAVFMLPFDALNPTV